MWLQSKCNICGSTTSTMSRGAWRTWFAMWRGVEESTMPDTPPKKFHGDKDPPGDDTPLNTHGDKDPPGNDTLPNIHSMVTKIHQMMIHHWTHQGGFSGYYCMTIQWVIHYHDYMVCINAFPPPGNKPGTQWGFTTYCYTDIRHNTGIELEVKYFPAYLCHVVV
jgi:hypothetical protein